MQTILISTKFITGRRDTFAGAVPFCNESLEVAGALLEVDVCSAG